MSKANAAILSALTDALAGKEPNWQPVPPRACIKPTHEAATAFWNYWRENGETHKHGYYESTWGAINAALACGYSAPQDMAGKQEPVAYSALIKLASQMATGDGLPSPYLDDHRLPRMSRAGRSYLVQVLAKCSERAKDWAVEARKIADKLTAPQVPAQEPVGEPFAIVEDVYSPRVMCTNDPVRLVVRVLPNADGSVTMPFAGTPLYSAPPLRGQTL